MASGSKGTIDPDGTYHAPAQVKAKQSLAGCQVLPNNHVFNTRIDTLPLDPKSSVWMHAKDATGRPLISGRLKFNYGFPINVVTSHSPEQQMVFAYSPEADGPFHILPPADFKMESGYYSLPFSDVDRHSLFVETDTCNFQEMYNLYPAGSNTYNNCPRCTSQSGVRYSGSGYSLPEKATDAASLFLAPLAIHRDEVLAGSIETCHPLHTARKFHSSLAYLAGRGGGWLQQGRLSALRRSFSLAFRFLCQLNKSHRPNLYHPTQTLRIDSRGHWRSMGKWMPPISTSITIPRSDLLSSNSVPSSRLPISK